MGAASWAVPVGVLAAIVVVGLVWIWWAFPRAWKRGVKHDDDRVNEAQGADREAQRMHNRAIIERFARAEAAKRGEIQVSDPPPAYAA